MKLALMLVAAFLLGAATSYLIFRSTVKRLRSRVRELRAAISGTMPPPRTETMKRVIWVCLANGFLWVWCSYLLAYLDRPQIAETLSQVAVTEIIGVVLAYAIKPVVENPSKNNRWPDKADPPAEQTEKEAEG